jgi:tRNA1Val (adenine37-N6)-methyltransferase
VTARPEPAAGETLDRLAGEWWIFQLRDGHRYATDDVITAWAACQALPAPAQILDLGAGVGALGLMVLLRAPATTRLTSVEVLTQSARLLRKTLAWNELEERAQVIEADLRQAPLAGARFDLIVANPPYLPEGSALRSPHPQRASARLELHGDIFDYCRAAERHLADDGSFCFCHPAADRRPEQAAAAAGLTVLQRREITFREGRPPALAVFCCGRRGERRDAPSLLVRTASGEHSPAYHEVRRAMLIEA